MYYFNFSSRGHIVVEQAIFYLYENQLTSSKHLLFHSKTTTDELWLIVVVLLILLLLLSTEVGKNRKGIEKSEKKKE